MEFALIKLLYVCLCVCDYKHACLPLCGVLNNCPRFISDFRPKSCDMEERKSQLTYVQAYSFCFHHVHCRIYCIWHHVIKKMLIATTSNICSEQPVCWPFLSLSQQHHKYKIMTHLCGDIQWGEISLLTEQSCLWALKPLQLSWL